MINGEPFKNLGFADLGVALSCEDDLDAVIQAVTRERAIRQTMAQTGETRAIVTEMANAMDSMGEEAVLELTDGEPTTLRDALRRYVDSLDRYPNGVHTDTVAAELTAILDYPWPGEEEVLASHRANRSLGLEVRYPGGGRVEIWMGRSLLVDCDYAVETVKTAVEKTYRAVLGRVIGDREHVIQLSATEVEAMRRWLERPSGSLPGDHPRLSMDAVEGGGVLVRTRPYSYEADLAVAQSRYRKITG